MKRILLSLAFTTLLFAEGNSHSLSGTLNTAVNTLSKRATVVTVTVNLITPGLPAVTSQVTNLATGQVVYTTTFVSVPPVATCQLSVSEGDIVRAGILILGSGVFNTHTVTAADIANGGFTITI
ncbi:hypothetical protein SAMN05444266_109375 [Chitinophaga jiangningensis]|uniref:DUF5666 domain-containing protein n=1 Tax=Chitinophaga jiangningensis TaxID=1419482 RepID=A0A1M7KK72_9BACT|nr:hypothetical protein [Chitinophaga jiangningensis]SHM65741.1 hypothetical protein SAMN05444266_109375 [Chitinophaga jiangningensis]